MDKMQLRAAARAFMRESQTATLLPDRTLPRTSREATAPGDERTARPRERSASQATTQPGSRGRTPPPLDKTRARQACSPMGALQSIVVTVDARQRRRTWYIVDPDPAVAAQYAAAGLDLTPGCKVLVDAEIMRPVALVDFDPAVSAQDDSPMPHGFNPYFDLPGD